MRNPGHDVGKPVDDTIANGTGTHPEFHSPAIVSKRIGCARRIGNINAVSTANGHLKATGIEIRATHRMGRVRQVPQELVAVRCTVPIRIPQSWIHGIAGRCKLSNAVVVIVLPPANAIRPPVLVNVDDRIKIGIIEFAMGCSVRSGI